jgi:ATP-dependent protease ClpP protease subunit
MRATIVLCAALAASGANAANIGVTSLGAGQPALVTISGDLDSSDIQQFRTKTASLAKAIVAFQSDGGSLVAGITIGEIIRLKAYATLVPENSRCASACAIAWLGGTPRFMGDDAQIGFHAAYNSTSGEETGVGNALVGAYLNKIGLPYSAVIYITQAAPQTMTWMRMADAEKYGIDVAPFRSSREPSAVSRSPDAGTPASSNGVSQIKQRAQQFIATLYRTTSGPTDEASAALNNYYEAPSFVQRVLPRL